MRYYNIMITQPSLKLDAYGGIATEPGTGNTIPNPNAGQPVVNPATGNPFFYTSLLPDGNTNPNALNIELDFFEGVYAMPIESAWIRVWGVGLQDISQSASLVGNEILLSVGMMKGLPLANPLQAGPVLKGYINQAFGNWVGVDQTLDLFVTSSPYPVGSPAAPINMSLDWKAGQPLSDALSTTLKTAFPGLDQKIDISSDLVQTRDEPDVKNSLYEFASWLKQKTAGYLTEGYDGVDITIDQNTIHVFDNHNPASRSEMGSYDNPIQVQFQDLIGQPTWISSGVIQIKCVMRADIGINDYILMPKGALATVTQQSTIGLVANSNDYKTAFQGKFRVTLIHHIGNFRQADAASWVTVINASTSLGKV